MVPKLPMANKVAAKVGGRGFDPSRCHLVNLKLRVA